MHRDVRSNAPQCVLSVVTPLLHRHDGATPAACQPMCAPSTLRVIEFIAVVFTALYVIVHHFTTPDGAAAEATEREKAERGLAAAVGLATSRLKSRIVESSEAALWAVPGEAAKSGASWLLFAYGDASTLSHFLGEAATAARSFKEHNPEMQIAVVTNNASVDRALFSHVLRPREDLLFPGSPCPYEKDPAKAAKCSGRRRQWATRLYYMALSPFELTWALDSNAISCTPGAAGRFLAAARASPPLWGLDIAHASAGHRQQVERRRLAAPTCLTWPRGSGPWLL